MAAKQQLLAILPKITGSMSLAGSLYIAHDAAQKLRESPYMPSGLAYQFSTASLRLSTSFPLGRRQGRTKTPFGQWEQQALAPRRGFSMNSATSGPSLTQRP